MNFLNLNVGSSYIEGRVIKASYWLSYMTPGPCALQRKNKMEARFEP